MNQSGLWSRGYWSLQLVVYPLGEHLVTIIWNNLMESMKKIHHHVFHLMTRFRPRCWSLNYVPHLRLTLRNWAESVRTKRSTPSREKVTRTNRSVYSTKAYIITLHIGHFKGNYSGIRNQNSCPRTAHDRKVYGQRDKSERYISGKCTTETVKTGRSFRTIALLKGSRTK